MANSINYDDIEKTNIPLEVMTPNEEITPKHKASMAIGFSLGIALLFLICIVLYAWRPDKNGPILEIAKIGLLPLVASIVAYYFSRN
ncbi:hypothetical protein [Piscirickettsia litoralis]|uniref:Uncharacterized protein n=1 Tax=Piscirickettsia litoralis TaxID=1891921 RepID=A0ABX3A515_9GAMM|nr:hypothetical protein [Piscirickettsia litoralis]ODN41204.1 hypothetical protein BGC07_17475 [Piscirickettsia litoralis]